MKTGPFQALEQVEGNEVVYLDHDHEPRVYSSQGEVVSGNSTRRHAVSTIGFRSGREWISRAEEPLRTASLRSYQPQHDLATGEELGAVVVKSPWSLPEEHSSMRHDVRGEDMSEPYIFTERV